MRHRLHSICPYFGIFPETFVREHVLRWTRPGDVVLDPFSGRGTTVLESLLQGRQALGGDTNPVAYCLSAAKACPPPLQEVMRELDRLQAHFQSVCASQWTAERKALPPFFAAAFHWRTLNELLYLRRELEWKTNAIHTFIAALLLGSLHGEIRSPYYFSNQMPRTISPKPDYAVRFWRANSLLPQRRRVYDILRQRAQYRLLGADSHEHGFVSLRDVRSLAEAFPTYLSKVNLVVTSPPYYNVTNYEEDQWLRLWALGHQPHPTYRTISGDDRHTSKEKYWQFLSDAWQGIAPLLRDDAVIVCRLAGRRLSDNHLQEHLMATVRSAFPRARLSGAVKKSEISPTETSSFRSQSAGCRFELYFTIRTHGR